MAFLKMSILTIAWSFASAACFTLALQHLLIWSKNRKIDANFFLVFAASLGAMKVLGDIVDSKIIYSAGEEKLLI